MTQQSSTKNDGDDDYSYLFQGEFPYNKQKYSMISNRRHEMDGQLLFDLLVGGIEHGDEDQQQENQSQSHFPGSQEIISLYPPKNEPILHELYLEIRNSEQADPVKRACLILYLLLDLDNNDIPVKFAKAHSIPEGYVRTVMGFHELDQGLAKQALKNLTHVSTRPQYPEKVLVTISNTIQGQALRSQYICNYVNSTQCALNTQHLVNIYFTALCNLPSPLGALEFIRSCTADIRAHLLTQLVGSYVIVNEKEEKKNPLLLANLPFNNQEETYLYNALTEFLQDSNLPQNSRIISARIILIRRIHLGDFLNASTLIGDIINGVFKNLSESDFSSPFIPDWHDLQNAINFTIPSAAK